MTLDAPALAAMSRIERQTSLSELVVGRLKDLITAGELRPGDALPSETRLAARLGVARSTIREAKKVLSLVGAFDVRAGKGTFVHPDAIRRLAAARVLDRIDPSSVPMLEVYEGRAVLEGGIVALAAARATAADVEAVRAALARMEAAARAGDVTGLVEADCVFHLAVAGAAHNDYLRRAHEHTAGLRADAVACISQVPGNVQRAVTRHRELSAAIEAGQPARARAALGRLLRDGRKTVEGALA